MVFSQFISLKKATPAQAGIISKLATETFYETYSWDNTVEDMQEYTETHFNPRKTEEELKESGTHFLLAYANDEMIGYAKMRNAEHPPELKDKKYIEVERIYVLQKFQQHKVGYALIKACIDFASQQKLDCVWLGVWEKNTPAVRFYEKNGFKQFDKHIFKLGDDEQTDLLLKRELKY